METQTLSREQAAPVAGTVWTIDPLHSTIGFSVKHMMFATVHGRFTGFRGTIRFEGGRHVEVEAEIDAATIDTGIKKRDQHLRSADFFDVAAYPTISFRGTRVEPVNSREGNRWLVVGNLTMHGVTRAVELAVEQTGFPELWDADDLEFRAAATISRKDFGMTFNLPIEGGGLVVGDDVKITLSVTASSATFVPR
jgi:polyisoprenoid-binding protein YceI